MSFSMSLWLSCILTWTLIWIQTNVCTSKHTTNKQTHMYGHLKRGLNHLISQNVHHINHNKDINKWSDRGLICMDFHAYCHRDLWFHQCSLISMTWSRLSIGWTTQVPAPPPGTPSSCFSWADQLRTNDITPHKRTCSYWLFMTTGVHFATFQLRPYPIFWNTALSPWHNHNK